MAMEATEKDVLELDLAESKLHLYVCITFLLHVYVRMYAYL